jgi:histidine triad (HIT) family protein
MACSICEIFSKKELFKLIYEDEVCIAILHESPANYGHALVVPKEHYVIMEEIPDNILEHLFSVSNLISSALFESLNIQGTNILVNNGTDAGQENPHFLINIIQRTENDGINFEWNAKPAAEDDLKTAELKLNQYTKNLVFEKEKPKPLEINREPEEINNDEENYMVRSLKKMP